MHRTRRRTAPPGADDLLCVRDERVPRLRRSVGVEPGLFDELPVPGLDDDVEQERKRPDLALVGRLRANRRDEIVDHRLRDVGIPRLDRPRLDQRAHLHEWRHPDVHVPGALLLLGLGDEAVDPEALDGSDLRVELDLLGVVLVDLARDVRVQPVDPLVEGRRQRPGLRARERRSRTEQRRDTPDRRTCAGAASEQLPRVSPGATSSSRKSSNSTRSSVVMSLPSLGPESAPMLTRQRDVIQACCNYR